MLRETVVPRDFLSLIVGAAIGASISALVLVGCLRARNAISSQISSVSPPKVGLSGSAVELELVKSVRLLREKDGGRGLIRLIQLCWMNPSATPAARLLIEESLARGQSQRPDYQFVEVAVIEDLGLRYMPFPIKSRAQDEDTEESLKVYWHVRSSGHLSKDSKSFYNSLKLKDDRFSRCDRELIILAALRGSIEDRRWATSMSKTELSESSGVARLPWMALYQLSSGSYIDQIF